MIPENVVREIEEKAAKNEVSIASILKERGIASNRFYSAKRKYEGGVRKRGRPAKNVNVVRLAPAQLPSKSLSLPECLTQLKTITENLNRIFRGL